MCVLIYTHCLDQHCNQTALAWVWYRSASWVTPFAYPWSVFFFYTNQWILLRWKSISIFVPSPSFVTTPIAGGYPLLSTPTVPGLCTAHIFPNFKKAGLLPYEIPIRLAA